MTDERDLLIEPPEGTAPETWLRRVYPRALAISRALAEDRWRVHERAPRRRLLSGWYAEIRLEASADAGIRVSLDCVGERLRVIVMPDTRLLRVMWWLLSISTALLLTSLWLRHPPEDPGLLTGLALLSGAAGVAVAELSLRRVRPWLARQPGWALLCGQMRSNLRRVLSEQDRDAPDGRPPS